MRKLVITLSFIFLFSLPALAQCPKMPVGFVCITQEAANQARKLAVEAPLKDEKIAVLEDGLKAKDLEIAKVQKARDENEIKLTKAIHDTESKLSFASGQLTKCDAFAIRDAALIEFLVKNQRSKQNGVINLKFGGN